MTIQILKKATKNAKPSNWCPWYVDEPLATRK
jgi:hypothetical protein